MRRTQKDNYILEEFASFGELCEVCDSRPVVSDVTTETARRKEYDNWYGDINSFDEARHALLYGYDKNFNELNHAIKSMDKAIPKTRPTPYANVVGFTPIVPSAILGLPDSMLDYKHDVKKQKVVSLLVDNGVACGVSASEVLDFGKKLMARVLTLEKSGYRVKIDAVKTFNVDYQGGRNNFHHLLKVPIKNETQPIDVKRVCFPLTEVAFLRSIAFDWYERLPSHVFDSGYGRSMSVLDGYQRKEVEKLLLADNEYYICYGDNLDEIFKEV